MYLHNPSLRTIMYPLNPDGSKVALENAICIFDIAQDGNGEWFWKSFPQHKPVALTEPSFNRNVAVGQHYSCP
jgi:hypothetical protein